MSALSHARLGRGLVAAARAVRGVHGVAGCLGRLAGTALSLLAARSGGLGAVARAGRLGGVGRRSRCGSLGALARGDAGEAQSGAPRGSLELHDQGGHVHRGGHGLAELHELGVVGREVGLGRVQLVACLLRRCQARLLLGQLGAGLWWRRRAWARGAGTSRRSAPAAGRSPRGSSCRGRSWS